MFDSRLPICTDVMTMVVLTRQLAASIVVESCDITHSEMRVLTMLSGKSEGMASADLSSKLRLGRSQTYAVERSLVEKGLARRVSRPEGGQSALTITAGGRRQEAVATEALVRFSMGIMDGMAADVDRYLDVSRGWLQIEDDPSFREFVLGHVEGTSRIYRSVAKSCRENGLSVLEYRVLLYILEFPEGGPQFEMARDLLVAPSNLSTTLKTLERCGYVSRFGSAPFERDGEVRSVAGVSQRGRDAVKSVTAAADRAFMGVHGMSDAEMRESIVGMYRAGLREYRLKVYSPVPSPEAAFS